eukprot:GHVR01177443.1.p1 GENE.GHVR01177443.1~~GHVR01177443.1.p1  ORF type:complete len:234 (+),score=66.29 GHVR01177443.1:161-862(+)
MEEGEAHRQIQQMVNFILNEAKDKAQEIEAKALEDFNIEKLKLVQQMKEKIRSEYQKKAKQVEVQRSIQRSAAVNKSRLKKIEARNRIVNEVVKQANNELSNTSKDKNKYKKLLIKIVVQGLLRLLEEDVVIKCRECDVKIITEIIPDICKQYNELILQQAQVNKNVNLTIDTNNYLHPPPSGNGNDSGRTCAGGVELYCQGGRVSLDNTLDTRLKLVAEDCKPQIRASLFPK